MERLRPVWPAVTRSAVYWNIDYLAVKLRLRTDADGCGPARRANGKKDSLVSLALRFDLVHEGDLAVLGAARSEVAG